MNGILIFLAVLGVPALMILSVVWRGYVIATLWGWFVVPAFDARPLPVALTIGLSLIVGLLTNHKTGNEAESARSDGHKFAVATSMALLMPAFFLLVGWTVHQFA